MSKKNTAQLNEERTAAASYILNFYSTVQTLTSEFANYCNVLEELQSKYGNSPESLRKVDPTEQEAIRQRALITKYWVRLAFIQWSSIAKQIGKQETEDEFSKAYKTLSEQFIMDSTVLQTYVVEANGKLVGEIVQNLLQTSQEVIDEIYGSPDSSG